MESFLNDNNVLNISVRYSPTHAQQRGGKKAREKRRERREQERTSLENGEIKEERNEYGIQDNQSDDSDIHRIQDYCEQACLKLFPEKHHLDDGQSVSQDNQYDLLYKDQCDYIDIHRQINKASLKLLPEKDHSDAGPVTSFKKPVTSRHRDLNRLVKVKPDRENTGHLIGLLEHKMEHKFKLLEHKIQLLESERQKDQEQMSRTRQTERLKSKQTDKQNRQTNRTWCYYCRSYVTQFHYCNIKKIYIHEDSWNIMLLEGNNEEELSLVGIYKDKFAMRLAQQLDAEIWLKKKHDEEQVLAKEKEHMLMKTKPTQLIEPPIITEETKGELVLKWKLVPVLGPNLQNKYLVEYAKHPGEDWKELAIIEKKPFNQIELKKIPYTGPYQFRVSVFNRYGRSPTSRCLITTEQHRQEKIKQKQETKGTDIMTYNAKMRMQSDNEEAKNCNFLGHPKRKHFPWK